MMGAVGSATETPDVASVIDTALHVNILRSDLDITPLRPAAFQIHQSGRSLKYAVSAARMLSSMPEVSVRNLGSLKTTVALTWMNLLSVVPNCTRQPNPSQLSFNSCET